MGEETGGVKSSKVGDKNGEDRQPGRENGEFQISLEQ